MRNIDKELASRDIKPLKNVSFYLITSNSANDMKTASLIMSRKFGLKYWSID